MTTTPTTPPTTPARTTWGRGLFRIWTAGALLWIAVATATHWRQLACKWLPADSDGWQSYSCNPFDRFDAALDTIGPILGAPVGALVVGGLVYWAAKGFRRG
jgi:hypothetical protein